MTGAVAFLGVSLGWMGSWLCGRRRRRGWLLCAAGSAVWLAVNVRLHLAAGVVNSTVAVTLALRNWRLWRATPPSASPAAGEAEAT